MKKKTATIAAGVSAGVLVASMLVACSMAAEQNSNNVNLNRQCREIRSTQAYIETKHEYERQVLESYKAGTLTAYEYDDKLQHTNTNEFIYENLDTLTSAEQAQDIRECVEQKDVVQSIGEGAILTSLGSFFVGGACVMKALPEEKHRGKKKKEQSGSIMSRCRYKDLLKDEQEEPSK